MRNINKETATRATLGELDVNKGGEAIVVKHKTTDINILGLTAPYTEGQRFIVSGIQEQTVTLQITEHLTGDNTRLVINKDDNGNLYVRGANLPIVPSINEIEGVITLENVSKGLIDVEVIGSGANILEIVEHLAVPLIIPVYQADPIGRAIHKIKYSKTVQHSGLYREIIPAHSDTRTEFQELLDVYADPVEGSPTNIIIDILDEGRYKL